MDLNSCWAGYWRRAFDGILGAGFVGDGRGAYFVRAFGVSEEEFLKYGFEQLLGGILKTSV